MPNHPYPGEVEGVFVRHPSVDSVKKLFALLAVHTAAVVAFYKYKEFFMFIYVSMFGWFCWCDLCCTEI